MLGFRALTLCRKTPLVGERSCSPKPPARGVDWLIRFVRVQMVSSLSDSGSPDQARASLGVHGDVVAKTVGR